MGEGNTASGETSVALGYYLTSGKQNTSTSKEESFNGADYTAAFGIKNSAIASGAFVAGGAGKVKWSIDGDKWFVQSNPNTASGWNAVAMGEGNTAIGRDSFVMGSGSFAVGDNSFAIGNGSMAGAATLTYSEDVSYEYEKDRNGNWLYAEVTEKLVTTQRIADKGTGAVAMGNSQAYGNYSTAQGNSQAGYVYYKKSGTQYTLTELVRDDDGFVVPINPDDPWEAQTKTTTYDNYITKVTGGEYATASGTGKAYGNYSIAMGNGAQTGEGVEDPDNDGEYIVQGGLGAVALGTNVKAIGNYSVAMGNGAVATPDNSFAFGGTVASGHTASVALGYGSETSGAYEVSVGSSTQTRKITNVTGGDVTSTSTDAVTGKQLYSATYITDKHNYYDGSTTPVDVKTALSSVDTQVQTNTGKITTLQGYFTNGVANKAASDANGNDIATTYATKTALTALDTTVTDLSTTVAGHTTSIETNTTNISNLQTTVSEHTASISTLNTNVTTIQGNITTLQSDVTTLKGDASTVGSVDYKIAQATTGISADITTIKTYVKTTGLDANDKKITNVKAGTAATDAANLGQVQNYSTVKVGDTNVNTGTGVNFMAGSNVSITTSGNTITISADGGSGKGTGTDSTLLGKDSTASGEGSTAIGYNNTVSGKYSTAVGYKNTVTGDASGAFGDPNDVSGDGSYAVGNNNTIAGDNNFVLGNNVNVGSNVTNSVVLGNGSTVTESNVVSVGSENNKRKITNVAAGTSAYDAVNYAQYSDLANNMERRFSKVNEDIGRTGAASAALASLHPQMMRKGESQIMAGMGRYHGKSGAAVGLAWQPHKRIMLSGGFADAAGEIMFNFGASYKFGQHSYTAEQLAEINNGTGLPLYVAELNAVLKSKDVQIMNLKSDNAAIKADNAAIREELAELKAIVAELAKTKK